MSVGTSGGGPGMLPPPVPGQVAPSSAAVPDWLQPILAQYGGGGYQYTPEDLQAIANYEMQQQMQLQFGQQQYQDAYLQQKGRELDLNSAQLDQMQKEFAFQSGPYWDWFKNDAFQFEKDKLGMEKQLSQDQLVNSANSTISSRYAMEANKSQAQAAQWQAMQAMGLVGTQAVAADNSSRPFAGF